MTSTRKIRGFVSVLAGAALVIAWLSETAPAAWAQGGGTPATVYRDEHGVPHIEAETEEAAWYAMGHEQTRDALFWIQANVKRQRGEASLFLSSAEQFNDLVVEVLEIHLGGLTEAELKAMFRVPNEPNPDQYYNNIVAYTKGLNDYRVALSDGNVVPEELPAQTWLRSNGHHWVLDHKIEVADILSWGRWQKASLNWTVASFMDPTPNKDPVVSGEPLLAEVEEIAEQQKVPLAGPGRGVASG